VEDVAFEQGVGAAGDVAEGAGEEDDGYQGAVVGLEALEQGQEGGGVEEVVGEGFVQEGEGVEAVDCGLR